MITLKVLYRMMCFLVQMLGVWFHVPHNRKHNDEPAFEPVPCHFHHHCGAAVSCPQSECSKQWCDHCKVPPGWSLKSFQTFFRTTPVCFTCSKHLIL
jgi:hypothetical protein